MGAGGQARIARASLEVPLEGLAARVAARYLAGAGVARLRVRDAATAEAARAVDPRVEVVVDPALLTERNEREGGRLPVPFTDPAARDLAAGAYEALRLLRGVLEDPS